MPHSTGRSAFTSLSSQECAITEVFPSKDSMATLLPHGQLSHTHSASTQSSLPALSCPPGTPPPFLHCIPVVQPYLGTNIKPPLLPRTTLLSSISMKSLSCMSTLQASDPQHRQNCSAPPAASCCISDSDQEMAPALTSVPYRCSPLPSSSS